MVKKLLLIVTLILVITIIIYSFLGGYSKVEFELLTDDLTIYGSPYQGSVESQELDSIISHFQQLSKSSESKFTVVDYFTDSEDSISQFIGITSAANFKIPSIEMKEVTMLKAKITAHPIVMPLPEEVKDAAQKFAAANDYRLDEFSIEIYSESGELIVFFPVKAK
ncbi:MAG: hypothetical protein RLO81_04190 [Fulvivirga sp.]|uniref:hypothetical protein n=1 Tax=Fulvivirga sp. TaxID=1931237 RepID=UPI0032EFD107